MNKDEKEIWDLIQTMNRCWTCGDIKELAKLNNYFHENMVAITATDNHRVEGRKACVNGWSEFAKNSKIHFWKELDPKIQIYGNAAVVTYYFDMSFDMGGQSIKMGGRDMFTLVKEKGNWLIVADQYSPYPNQQ